MKRGKRVSKGQVEKREVKRSKSRAVEESSSSTPEINPFLVEPVLVKLLKLVDEVSQLKELRKMCQTWDEFNLKEIEDRAFNGKVKAIDFCWTQKLKDEADLVQFMGDTLYIPRLFSSFKFNFPESWIILSKHMEFFSLYPVTFVHLGIPKYRYSSTKKQREIWALMTKFMDSEIGGNLKVITISTIDKYFGESGFPGSSLFVPPPGNITKKLQKLTIKCSFTDIFQSVFASGMYTNLTSMELSELRSGDLDFPGLDPSKLTRLEIGKLKDGPSALKLTSGLFNLARNGMTLKDFGIKINLTNHLYIEDDSFVENLPLICSNMTQFLSSQSLTLETMTFCFVCHLDRVVRGAESCKIHLPTFELLHTLKLKVYFQLIEANPRRVYSQLFGMTQSLSGHFPKLVNLTLQKGITLDALRVNVMDAGKLELEHLEIIEPSVISRNPESLVTAFVSGNCANLTLIGLDEIPSANLEYLGVNLSKITRLEINLGKTRKSLAALKLTSGLINLAGNGMKLKNLCISIILKQIRFYDFPEDIEFFFEHLGPICSNLSQFLSSQSSTLESLNFTFACHLKDPVDIPEGAENLCKIHLPKFEALKTLKLCVDFQIIEAKNPRKIHTQLFGMTNNPSLHFPKLVNLTLDGESSLIALRDNPATGEAGQLQLEHLEIIEYDKNPRIWTTSFEGVIGSVEEFDCPAKFLKGRLPWGESLRQLYIYEEFLRVKQGENFKLDNLKKLKSFSIKYFAIRTERWTDVRTRSGTQPPKVDHLRCFKEATELPLTSINFMGPEIGEDLKEEFRKYFPFPVLFKEYTFQKNEPQFHNFAPKYF